MKADTQRAAIKEATSTDYFDKHDTLAALAKPWLASDCPNSRLERRPGMVKLQTRIVANLVEFFGSRQVREIRPVMIPAYAAWRQKKCHKGTGDRTVDLDLVTLSCILTFGVLNGQLDQNPIKYCRPKYSKSSDVSHARERMPATATVIHRLADAFFGNVRSEVFGWVCLFSMFTGCRRSELVKLRMDAGGVADPGFVQWRPQTAAAEPGAPLGLLHIERSKHGTNPEVIIGPEFANMIASHRRWHAARFPENPYYFPGRDGRKAVDIGSFGHALRRQCADLGLLHISPHGFRSYYVTKRRSDGVADQMIAAEIGDATVALMATTYGQRPKSWIGGEALGWLPKDGLPAWARWNDAATKIVTL